MPIDSDDHSCADSSGEIEAPLESADLMGARELSATSDRDEPRTVVTEQSPRPAPQADDGSSPARLLGDFELIQEIGRGGMGVVYEARQRSLGKRVAVKVLPYSAMMDKRVVRRFQNEAWAAGQLQHRNIVPVYHVGNERGIHFYAMQFIDGVDLGDLYQSLRHAAKHRRPDEPPRPPQLKQTRRITPRSEGASPTAGVVNNRQQADPTVPKRDSTHRSDHSKKDTFTSQQLIDYVEKNHSTAGPQCLATLAKLGIQVADALHYAHEMGIVHRDIKPSNLLFDWDGDVWVSDFGLAQIENNPQLTATGAMVGTLRYMSPEQILGRRVGVDHRTDIYSLGITLYELMTLRYAFAGDNREAIIRMITFDDPIAPRKIDRRIPIELETIVMKALSKNPSERYQTAAEMADDLRRFRNNEPIKGRMPTVPQRLGRWARRHRALVASGGSLLLITFVAALAIVGILWNLFAVTAAALQTEQVQKAKVEGLYQRSDGLRLAANSSIELSNNPVRSLLLAVEGAKRFPGSGTNRAILDALDANHEVRTLTGHLGPVGHVAFNADGTRLVSTAASSRFDAGPEAAMIWDTQSGQLVGKLVDTTTITSAVFSPDRFRILTASSSTAARTSDEEGNALADLSPSLWDAVNQTKLLSFEDAFVFEAHVSAFDPQGRRVVFPSKGHLATIYDCVAGHRLVQLVGHDQRVVFAAFSPQGDRVVTASDDNTVRVWDAGSGKQVNEFDLWRQRDPNNDRCMIDSVSFRPDGRQIVTGSSSLGIHLWDLSSNERVNSQHIEGGVAAYWPSAAQILTHFPSGVELAVRNASDGRSFRTLRPDGGLVQQAELSPDGQWIAMRAHSDTTLVSIWNTARGTVDAILRGHRFVVNDIAFSPNSKMIATASSDKTVKLWHRQDGRDRMTYPTVAWFNEPLAVASPDGKQVAVVERNDSTVSHVLDFEQADHSLEISSRISMPNWTSTRFVAFSNELLVIHSITDGQGLASITSPNGPFLEAAINRDGDRVAAAAEANALVLWFPDENRQVMLADDDTRIFSLRFNPAGDRLASASADGFVRLWDADTGESLAELQCDGVVLDVVFSPDATQIAAATDQDRAVLWDIQSLQKLQTLQAPGVRFNHVEFSFDGDQLVAYHSSDSDAVHLWSVDSGNLETKLDVTGRVHVAMHPQQDEALVTSTDHGAVIWDYNQNLRQPITDEPMVCGRFSADGAEIVIGSSVPLPNQPWQLAEAPKSFTPPVLQRWRREDLVRVDSIELSSERIFELFLSSDGLALLNASRLASVANYDADSHELISRISGHAAQIPDCLFTSDSSRLITASWDHKITIWNAADGQRLKSLIGHQSAVHSLAISSDDRLLVSGAENGQCILWDLESGRQKQQVQLAEQSIRHVAVNPAGDQILAITSDHALHVYDVRARKEVALNFGARQIAWAEYSPDGTSLLVVPHVPETSQLTQQPAEPPTKNADHQVLLVPVDGDTITAIDHGARVVTAHFHPSGRQFISATEDGRVTLRDITTGQVDRQMDHPGANVTAVALSKSGEYAAVAEPGRVTVWKVAERLKWFSVPRMSAMPAPMHRYNPFVPQAGILLTQRTDSLEFRSCPLEPLEFAESRIPRPLTANEKTEFLID